METIDIPSEVIQWKFGGATGNLRSNAHYQNNKGLSLHNETKGSYLNYKDEIGMDLGFGSAEQKKYHLHIPDGSEREIRCGEPISLANGGGRSHIHYYHTAVGINLGWSVAPHFEWQVFAAGVKSGAPIPAGSRCALFNLKVEPKPDWLIHFKRPGGDIGWTTSPHWYDALTDQAKHLLKEAGEKAAVQGMMMLVGG